MNTCPTNPVIGDRAFGDDPATCSRFGVAWVRGLRAPASWHAASTSPAMATRRRTPTTICRWSISRRLRLEAVELAPFRAAAAAGVASMMTAHVVYTALDPERPATLSPAACTELRFRGGLPRDARQRRPGDAGDRRAMGHRGRRRAGRAAGCDALLVCWSRTRSKSAPWRRLFAKRSVAGIPGALRRSPSACPPGPPTGNGKPGGRGRRRRRHWRCESPSRWLWP